MKVAVYPLTNSRDRARTSVRVTTRAETEITIYALKGNNKRGLYFRSKKFAENYKIDYSQISAEPNEYLHGLQHAHTTETENINGER